MKARLFIFGLIAVIFVGCSETLPPVDFTHSTEVSNPLKVTFSANVPTLASEYGEMKLSWDFGDGITATGYTPTHTFKKPGDYNVKLVAEASKTKAKAEKTKVIPVTVNIENFNFTYSSNPSSPLDLTFEAKGSIENGVLDFEWDFGDNKTATGKSTIKTFANARVYPVALTATAKGTNYSQTVMKNVNLRLKVDDLDFTYRVNQNNPLEVQFIASSKSTTDNFDYEWDFGFNNIRKGKSVVYMFPKVGEYEVALIVKVPDSDSVVQIMKFKIPISMSILNANFSYGSDGLNPLNVVFSGEAESTDELDYEWDFGGGVKLRSQNTAYRFNDYGEHTVILKVSIKGTNISQFITKTINVAPPEIKDFGFKYTQSETNALEFYLEATAKAPYGTLSYEWDFGWGKTAKGQKPVVRFDNYGSNLVSLSVSINDTPAAAYVDKIITIPAPEINFPKDNEGTIKPFNYIRHPKKGEKRTVQFISNATISGARPNEELVLDYEWDFSWGGKGEGDQVIVNFDFYDTYPVKMITKIRDTNIKKTHYQLIDVGLNDNLTIDCYDNDGIEDINNLEYLCKATFSDGELKNPQFDWDFGDNSSGKENFSTERMPLHKFTELGKYTVKLTVTEPAATKPIVVTKDIVVLTIPIIDFRVRVLEQRLGDNVRLAHDLYSTWQKVNKKQVDVIVEISGSENSAVNGTHINDPRDFFVTKDENYRRPHDGSKTWNTCANFWVNITYRLKENKTIEKSTGVTAINCMWRDYLD